MCSARGLLPNNYAVSSCGAQQAKKYWQAAIDLARRSHDRKGATGFTRGCPNLPGYIPHQIAGLSRTEGSIIEFTQTAGWLTTGWVWSTFLPACHAQGSSLAPPD